MMEVFIPHQLSGEVYSAGGAVPLPPGYVAGRRVFSTCCVGRLASLVARAVTSPFPIVLRGGIASSACIDVIGVVMGAVIVDRMAWFSVFCMSSIRVFCCVHHIPIP